MTELLDLCYDVLIRILEEINPEDIAACAQTSRGFNTFIKKNTRLYKAIYLRTFDDPRSNPSGPEPEWVSELQNLVKCKKVLQSTDAQVKTDHLPFLTSTISTLIRTGTAHAGMSANHTFLTTHFATPPNLDPLIYRSSLYARSSPSTAAVFHLCRAPTALETQHHHLSAKLHCLHGAPASAPGRRSLSIHPYARAKVYDLRNYTAENKWGPFLADGSMRVDWEMLEAIMILLGYNSELCCRRYIPWFTPPWLEPFEGVVKDALPYPYVAAAAAAPLSPSIPRGPAIPLAMRDPYNVSGTWSRIVCFLDYNDLWAFNFSSPSDAPGQPRSPLNTEEAIRHLMMKIRVTAIEPAGAGADAGASKALPVVHFAGKTRSVDVTFDPNANSRIRGAVRMTPDGEVQWTTISIFYGGEQRWRSEGIQVGGPNAKRGVVGTWFDKDYDPHGPAGPTAFWKIADGDWKSARGLHEVEGDDDGEGSGDESDEEEGEEGSMGVLAVPSG
ncbi:hypothetical protein BDV95DRAFT_639108 [Massariosphaeria phaeospora]|uniref:F-box domain-containing protein n=1 Tax=Massariosphaeria phaeospora TaxID=100035 RepID=A0A7C8I3M6_9PLEO|nr:hypothetical protein BDV95DRAFT_639108 [Massariosphaeria phaeospora]